MSRQPMGGVPVFTVAVNNLQYLLCTHRKLGLLVTLYTRMDQSIETANFFVVSESRIGQFKWEMLSRGVIDTPIPPEQATEAINRMLHYLQQEKEPAANRATLSALSKEGRKTFNEPTEFDQCECGNRLDFCDNCDRQMCSSCDCCPTCGWAFCPKCRDCACKER
jgi:hypothetical protein